MIAGFARGGQGCARLRWWLFALALLGSGGCSPPFVAEEELPPARVLPLEAPVGAGATLAVDSRGRGWVGAGEELWRLDLASAAVVTRVPLGGGEAPRVVGEMGERLYVRSGQRLIALDAETGEIQAVRQQVTSSAVALDPWDRHLYLATETGAVLGLAPDSLRARWGWTRLGAEATAIAASPEGAWVYLALWGAAREGEGAARILTRDVQTGRVLAEVSFALPFRALLADAEGMVYGLAADEARGAVAALESGAEGLRVRWRRTLAELDLSPPAELRVSPTGEWVALFMVGGERPLAVLDARTGGLLGRIAQAPLDAAFGPDGALYLLYGEELRVVR